MSLNLKSPILFLLLFIIEVICMGRKCSPKTLALRKELIEVFTEVVNKSNKKELVQDLYRNPCCGHCCGISYVFMEVLKKYGVDENYYYLNSL